MEKLLLVTLFYLHRTSAVIQYLNDSEYFRMPPVFALDHYESCVRDPAGLYCSMDLDLVSDEPSQLLDMIHEYSNHNTVHFNHSRIFKGLCASKNCRNIDEGTAEDLRLSLEACLNESYWNSYELKVRVSDDFVCNRIYRDVKDIEIGYIDMATALMCVVIILLNIIGSFYDICFTLGENNEGIRFLLYFSIRRNWRRLSAPAADGPEPRFKRLKGLYGMRFSTMLLIITAHALLPSMMYLENPRYIENTYSDISYFTFYNGTLIVQTFFIMSGFLLVYNLLLISEKVKLNWLMFPKGIILRWIRLTPPYIVVLALVATWFRFIGEGPVWQSIAGREMKSCRVEWWTNILYINNYFENTMCMPSTWYLAADTQLYCTGIIVFLLARTPKTQKVLLSVLFLAGLVIPAAHVYFQDLDGVMVVSPETAKNFFTFNPTFDKLHKAGHTNLPSYVVGMATGYIVYYLQGIGFDATKYRKYRIFYWLLVPCGYFDILLGSIFYSDRRSIIVRMLYASLSRPFFGIFIALGIIGLVFKYENFYRGLGEWRVFTSLGRLSYSAFLMHQPLVRLTAAAAVSLPSVSIVIMGQQMILVVVVSFVLAFPFWILVEAPSSQLIKLFLPAKFSNTKNSSTGTVNSDDGVEGKIIRIFEEKGEVFTIKMPSD